MDVVSKMVLMLRMEDIAFNISRLLMLGLLLVMSEIVGVDVYNL